MFERFGFLSRTQRNNDTIIIALYEIIVAAARQPAIYAKAGAPDTPLGRFEMISLHMALVLNAGRSSDSQAQRDLLQALTEEFFKDVDHALRELGIGDTGVPKRMKKLASMFYGRADALRKALDANDDAELADAITRNLWPDAIAEHKSGGIALAPYFKQAYGELLKQMPSPMVEGQLTFPDAESLVQ